jgi:predicted membrane-bound spermidine synthase
MSGIKIGERGLATGALFVFALSGAAGLIYQAIWSQYLGLFLGHAAYAQSLVLAIFMGGMALGAWWISRYATEWRNLLRAYAYVELVIGLAAALFHREFLAVTGLAYDVVLPTLSSGFLSASFKWFSAIALILPQAILLGMTFPLMSNGVMRRAPGGDGSVLGGLYFSNSIGAALGALIATFVLLPAIGLPGAMQVGAALNILVALLAYMLAREDEAPRPRTSTGQSGVVLGARLLLVAAFVTGASSFIYEIGWVRMLSLALGSTVHAFELMLAAFIGGLALGGLWIRKRIDGYALPLRIAGWVQVLMGVAALASLILYDLSFDWVAWFLNALSRSEQAYTAYNVVSAIVAVTIMAPAAFFAGMTLPLFTLSLIRAGAGEAAVGRIYAANTVGAIVGVFLAVHLLIPGLGLKLAMIVAAVADLVLGVILLRPSRASVAENERRPYLSAIALAGIATVATVLIAKFDPLAMSAGVYRTGLARLEQQKLLFYRDSKTASIGVYEAPSGMRTISTNGKPDASIKMQGDVPSMDEITMILAAVLPLSMHPSPAEVANIGFGSGLTTHSVLADPRVKRVDTIEIEAAMIEGAKSFRPVVERAYSDPRAQVHIEDARSYFTAHKSKYDVIISEPSNPWVSGVSSLFSREFYRFVPRHLKPKGLFIQWIQLYEIEDELVGTVITALRESFSDYRVFLTNFGDMIIVASADGPVGEIDVSRLDNSDMKALLERVSLARPDDIAFHELGRSKQLNSFFSALTQRANSDFYPILSLEAPRSRFRSIFAHSLIGLPTADQPVLELLAGVPLPNGETSVTPVFPRTTFRKTAYAYVASRGEADASDATPEVRANLSAVRERVGRCRTGDAVQAQMLALQRVAAETIPFLHPQEMAGLWIKPDWLQCSTQPPAVKAMLAMLESAAARDHAETQRRAEALLEGHMDDMTPATAEYVLRYAMLAASAAGNDADVLRLERDLRGLFKATGGGNQRRWMARLALERLGEAKAAQILQEK